MRLLQTFRLVTRLAIMVLTVFLFAPNSQAQRTSHLTLQDLLSTRPIGASALSPDGKNIALERDGQIVLFPSDGSWPTTLTNTPGGKTGFSWSPDGKQIAYANRGSIWAVSVNDGASRRLTNAQPGAGDPRQATDRTPLWSPTGHWILFQSGRRGANSILVVSEDGNTTSFLTPPSEEASAASWSPDGNRIVYVARKKEYFSGRLNLIGFDKNSGQVTGDPVALYTAPVDRGGGWSIRGVSWSPDGKALATILQNSGWNHIYLVPINGEKPRQITDGEFEDESPIFSPDGKYIAFISNRNLLETRNLWVLPTLGGEAKQVAKFTDPGIASQPQWSPDGKRIYFNRQSSIETSDLLVQDLTSQVPSKHLTQTTPIIFKSIAQIPERITWKSKDGREIVGLLYTPRGAKPGTKFPAVLWIHGGPEEQDDFHFSAWVQYLAQAGYVVLEPNYRGGTGYGEIFRNLNVEDANQGEVDDVAGGVQYLISHGLADPKRITIGGASHGGTTVANVVAIYPDLFAAAIDETGTVDFELFAERSNPQSSIRWTMKMGGTIDEKPEIYRRANVLLAIDKIKTPLLILHGENDPQVPPAEAAEFARALKEHHKTYYYFTYPNELHGFSQPQHQIDAWQKKLAFLEHYINPKYGTTNTSTDDIAFPIPVEQQANAHP
jgi:dipeptidyl aminopeptidase/acylaminoacyl peptidase